MNQCYIGLGSNLGDRKDHLRQAIQKLEGHDKVRLTNQSSIYETEPFGPVPQPDYLNMVIEIETSLPPLDLLTITQSIEQQLKRERSVHWGPRTIDLDILLYADKIMKMETLIVPHPELTNRLFVLVPLRELNPFLIVPGQNKNIQELCDAFLDQEGVRLWKQSSGGEESGPFES